MSKYGLITVMQLKPVTYFYKADTTNHPEVGFIAQDVQKLIPEVVSGTEGDLAKGETLGLSYGNLVPVLTKAIQELKAENDSLKASLTAEQQASATQQTRILTLTNDLDTLKAQVAEILKQQARGK